MGAILQIVGWHTGRQAHNARSYFFLKNLLCKHSVKRDLFNADIYYYAT